MKKILIVLASILLLTGCGKKVENKVDNSIKIDVNQNEKIKLESAVIDNEIVVVSENISNDTIQNATVALAFFDENNKLINTEKENINNLKKGSKNVIVLNKDSDKLKRVEVVAKVLNEALEEKDVTYITDQIKSKVESEGENLVVHLVNVSGKKASFISSTLVLYKNNKIVAAYNFYNEDVENETVNKAVAWTNNNEDIDYDSKEVIINKAYITK